MGIDIIENSGLATFAPFKKNMDGFKSDGYENFLGIGKKQADVAGSVQAAQNIAATYPIKSIADGDCAALQSMLIKVQNDIESDLQKNLLPKVFQDYVVPKRDIEATLKTRIADAKCVEIQQAAQQQTQEQHTLDVLASVTSTPPPIVEQSATAKSATNTNKYIIYGVGGVIALASLFILLKKK